MKENFIQNKLFKQILFYAGLLLIWQLIVIMKIWPQYIFPSPLKVFSTIIEGFRNNTLWIGMAVSFKRLLIGFGVAIACGTALGVLMLKFKTLDETVGGLVLGLQTLPSICWFPLALLWFGLSEWAIIFVIIAGSLFSITVSTNSAFKNISPIYVSVGRNMGAYGVALLSKVIIPAALPSVIIGLRQGWSFAWRSLMAGELLFNSLGLGFLLNMGRELNDMSQVIGVMVVIAVISILVDRWIFGQVESRIRVKYGLYKK